MTGEFEVYYTRAINIRLVVLLVIGGDRGEVSFLGAAVCFRADFGEFDFVVFYCDFDWWLCNNFKFWGDVDCYGMRGWESYRIFIDLRHVD